LQLPQHNPLNAPAFKNVWQECSFLSVETNFSHNKILSQETLVPFLVSQNPQKPKKEKSHILQIVDLMYASVCFGGQDNLSFHPACVIDISGRVLSSQQAFQLCSFYLAL